MGSTSEWKGQKKKSENLRKDKSNLFSLNNSEKIDGKKMNRASGTCRTIKNI